MNKVVDIYAPLRNYTGYAEVVRNLVWRLYVLGWKINFEEFKGWSANGLVLSNEHETFFSMLEKNKYPSDRQLSICLPEQARLDAEKLNINLTMFEAKRRLPKLWIETSRKLDHIIVPTKQNYRLWYDNLGAPYEKMSLLPFGVSTNEVMNVGKLPIVCQDDKVDVCKEYKYQLLVLQEYISRKNLRGVLEAFYIGCVKNEERRNDTCLVLKLNSNSGDKLSGFKGMCDKVRKEIEAKYKVDLPHNLFVYTRILGDNAMYDFFNSFTHYFSMSNGEGWDMNCMKAVALGKTAIVPASSSYLEYLDEDKAHLIPCREDKFQIEESNLIRLYSDSMWDIPDVEVASDYIANIDKIGKRNCSKHILENFNWENAAKKLDKILESVSIDKPGVKIDRSYTVKKTTLMVCQTMGQRCGIGEYTMTLHKHFDKTDASVVSVSSDVYGVWDKIDQFMPSVVHFQSEYQFYTPKRLAYILNRLKEKNVKTVLTQHTFNEDVYTHNKLYVQQFDKIVFHNKYIVDGYVKCFGEDVRDKLVYVPMPVERVMTAKLREKVVCDKEEVGCLKIGFFGFCYFHKGLDRLITTVRNIIHKYKVDSKVPIMLYIYSSKPQQDQMNYYEQCADLIKAYNMGEYIEWNATYFQMDELLPRLAPLDVLCLPYDDYGSLGASAALATAVQAEGPRIICSKESPFFDVENEYAPNVVTVSNNDLKDHLDNIFVEHRDGTPSFTDKKVWDKYFRDRSWKNFAQQLSDIYKELGNNG